MCCAGADWRIQMVDDLETSTQGQFIGPNRERDVSSVTGLTSPLSYPLLYFFITVPRRLFKTECTSLSQKIFLYFPFHLSNSPLPLSLSRHGYSYLYIMPLSFGRYKVLTLLLLLSTHPLSPQHLTS